jgi:ubiquinone/menaquinone biosynthesis C-methylase UbiE
MWVEIEKSMKLGSLDPAHQSKLHDAEAMLRSHAGVREAAIIPWRSDNSRDDTLVGYVVPDDDYINRVLAGSDEQRKRMHKWRKTFDLSQLGKQAESADPAFNIAGWNSSYTRQPIPAEQMREWVDFTVQEISSFHPQEILEIGCGTGLLLLRLARECTGYVGADFAPAVLNKLKKQMDEMGGEWSNVTLLERSAENFDGFADDSFDTVIMNSVVKYFPSAAYLTGVLAGAVRVVKPGGRIFVGDVRNLALLEPYATSIELHHAPSSMSFTELRERIRHRIKFEEQLLLSPAFFLALQQRFPKIARVEIHPKRGHFDNEMTRFRFNAILYLGTEQEKRFEPSWLDCAAQRLTLESIAALLQKQKPEMLAIQNITNARIEKDVAANALLANAKRVGTVEDVNAALEKTALEGIHPEKLWSLGEKSGYHTELSWLAARPDGSYEVVFRRAVAENQPPPPPVAWPLTQFVSAELAQYANSPGRAVLREQLIEQLLAYSQEKLPKDAAPTIFLLMDALPLTAEGKVDVSALPAPALPHE